MGFNAPSRVGLLAELPGNIIVQWQSGRETLVAFVLAMLNAVDPSKNYPQVLCVSPTYELAIQTGTVAVSMAQYCPEIRLRYATRGEGVPRSTRITEHVIIGTPGKVVDWGVKLKLFDLGLISLFVLNEADSIVTTQGGQDQIFRIHKMLNSSCRMMVISALYEYEQDVMTFAKAIACRPVMIYQGSMDNIKQYYVCCPSDDDKYHAISNIFGIISIGRAIIYCQTTRAARWLSELMSRDGHAVALVTGELTAEKRITVVNDFRSGIFRVLITTSVLARGIELEPVTMVINLDLPVLVNGQADCAEYIHRIGRTGHFGETGIAINLVDGQEGSMGLLRQIGQLLGTDGLGRGCGFSIGWWMGLDSGAAAFCVFVYSCMQGNSTTRCRRL